MRFWTRRHSETPPVAGSLPVLEPKALLAPHQSKLIAIRKLVGVPKAHWQAFYLSAFEAYARFVQQFPASEAHHHAGPGGLLAHGLEVVREALKLRRGQLIPLGASAETLAATQDLWTYATASAALLHDLGKPVADQRVRLYDRRGRALGDWDAWAGPIGGDARWYRVEFFCRRSYRQHERISPLLARFVLPQALSWLGSEPNVLEAWLATLSGDDEHAGILGELVGQADRVSVAANLAGPQSQMPTATRKPLAERLLTGLRYLLKEERLPLNRRGAAGWLVGEDLWLVSKRVLDGIRAHLTEEGQSGVPTANDRMMDELQQYGFLIPNGDRAVWTAEVKLGEWCQQLTLLRFLVRILWPAAEARPAAFEGSVTPVSDRSPPSGEAEQTDSIMSTASATIDSRPRLQGAESARRLDYESATEDRTIAGDDAGQRFLHWLKDGLAAGHLPVNTVNARIHAVDEGVLLVSPGIFKDFNPSEWHSVQKRFQKLKLHRKTPDDTNVWTYAVNGKRKQSLIKGFVIPNPSETLGIEALPPPNAHLALPAEAS